MAGIAKRTHTCKTPHAYVAVVRPFFKKNSGLWQELLHQTSFYLQRGQSLCLCGFELLQFFCEKQKRTAASKACASKQPLVYCEEKSCKEKSGGSAEHCSSPRSCPCEKKKKKFKLAGLLAAYNIPRPGSGRTTGNTSANSGSLSDTAPVPHRLSVVVSQTWN